MNNYNLELIHRCKNGDKSAIEKLLDIFEKDLYKTNYYFLGDKELASSALNQVMTKLLSSIEAIDKKSCIYKLLYRLTINSCMEIEDKKSFVNKNNCNDIKSIIKSAIIKLPFEQRTVLILHDIQNLSYTDISEIVELPLTKVRSNLHKARLTIKEVLNSNKDMK